MKQLPLRSKVLATFCLTLAISFVYKVQNLLNSSLTQPAIANAVYSNSHRQVDKTWAQLPLDAHTAAEKLQWNHISWDNSEDSPLYHRPWKMLSKEEKVAAVVLGMDEEWTDDGDFDHLHWDNLPISVKDAAQKLGYNEDLWNNDETPSMGNTHWTELTSEQQDATNVLGYNEETWDEFVYESTPSAAINPKQTSIAKPQNGTPIFKLPANQTLCKLVDFEVVCSTSTRYQNVAAYPLFAEYYTDGDGTKVPKQSNLPSRPIAISWFKPDATKFCGNQTDPPCANVGDELGPMLLLALSGQEYIEHRYDGMDVVIIGSVLNFLVKKYPETANRVQTFFNTTVWGTGTKWKAKGVCFDFRAVRGPKTRDKYIAAGCNVPEVYGDPALLFPYLYTPKKLNLPDSDLCLVPHIGDLGEDFQWWTEKNGTSLIPRFTYYDHHTKNKNKVVRVIDIRTPDAAAFIDLLASCKLVASASLHGIILAEAYNITWSWIRLRDKHEDPFKYNDFFLSVGVDKTHARPLKIKASTPVDTIINHTMTPKIRGPILYDPVKLLDACPFCDAEIVRKVKARIKGE